MTPLLYSRLAHHYLYLLQLHSDIIFALIHPSEPVAPNPIMSTAATFIPAFAAITLLIGGFNELSMQLTLVGILAIILHTAITSTEERLSCPYPSFDNYHLTQPPFRDYVLVFGLASLGLVALFSRFYPLVSGFLLLFINHTYLGFPSLPALFICSWPARSQCPSALVPYSQMRLPDPSIGYRSRSQLLSHPSHSLPFALLHWSVDSLRVNPRRRIPCPDHSSGNWTPRGGRPL